MAAPLQQPEQPSPCASAEVVQQAQPISCGGRFSGAQNNKQDVPILLPDLYSNYDDDELAIQNTRWLHTMLMAADWDGFRRVVTNFQANSMHLPMLMSMLQGKDSRVRPMLCFQQLQQLAIALSPGLCAAASSPPPSAWPPCPCPTKLLV